MSALKSVLRTLVRGGFIQTSGGSGQGSAFVAGPNGCKVGTKLRATLIRECGEVADTSPSRTAVSQGAVVGEVRRALDRTGRGSFAAVKVPDKQEEEEKESKVRFQFEFEEEGKPHLSVKSLSSPLEWLFFMHEDGWKSAFLELTLRRRRLWKRLICNDPWLIEQDQQGGATDYPSANVSFNTKDLKLDLPEPPRLLLEEASALDGEVNFPREDLTGLRMARIRSHPSQAVVAVLLDAVRKRMFRKTTRTALSLDVVPFECGFLCAETPPSQDLRLLAQFLSDLAADEGVELVPKQLQSLEQADLLGVPLVAIVSEKSLASGVVHLRDRETCWYEEVHVAHLARRLAAAFGKGEAEDSLNKVEKQLREEGKLPEPKKKKTRKKAVKGEGASAKNKEEPLKETAASRKRNKSVKS